MATTTNYGWETPDNTDLVKDGALAMRDLGQDVDTTLATALNANDYAGLVLLKKQTIGSGVASVAVTSAFSSAYENYRIVVANSTASAGGTNIRLTFNNSAGSTYFFAGNFLIYNGTNTFIGDNNITSSTIGLSGTNNTTNLSVDVLSPFLAQRTTFNSQYATNAYAGNFGGLDNNAVSHTGFTIALSGTLTGGTIYVYGYGAS
jgi:L-asparaginase/Glu-tRNA(Gln) amidotransferase subunit D